MCILHYSAYCMSVLETVGNVLLKENMEQKHFTLYGTIAMIIEKTRIIDSKTWLYIVIYWLIVTVKNVTIVYVWKSDIKLLSMN